MLRGGRAAQVLLKSHADMVDAVWMWLAAEGAAVGAGAADAAGDAAAAAHTAAQLRVACVRIAYALAEGNFGPVKVMHAAPACFDGARAPASVLCWVACMWLPVLF